MNNLINSLLNWFTAFLNKIPKPIQVAIGIGLVIVFMLFLWYRGTQAWNDIGNFFFHRQISAERVRVQKDLDSAAEQKRVLEQTLREFADAKKELETVKAEKDKLEKLFNDQSKTAAEKVAEFKKAMSDDPDHTPTDDVTTEDLCARAKAIGSSAATITALCGQ